jgi:uncharacterized membrane protein YphA (DoxX/SURF4 family)
MLAGIFVASGSDAVRNPEPKVKQAEAVTGPLSRHLSIVPDDAALLVRINGGVQVVAGVLLSIGKLRRLSALALAASIVPTTYAGHRFWEAVDPDERARQQTHFLKNVGLLGGLVLALADTEGAPSTSWKVHHRLTRTRRRAASRRAQADHAMGRTLESVSEAGSQVLRKLDDLAAREAPKVVDAASQYLSAGAEAAGHLVSQAQSRLAHQ